MTDRNISMGPPRPISAEAQRFLNDAEQIWALIKGWPYPLGNRGLIREWHTACEVVVAELMGFDAYNAVNPLDKRS